MHRVPLAQREYLVVRVVGKTPRPAETTTRHCQSGSEGRSFGADPDRRFLGLCYGVQTRSLASCLRHQPRQEPRALTRMRGSVRGTGVSQFPTAMNRSTAPADPAGDTCPVATMGDLDKQANGCHRSRQHPIACPATDFQFSPIVHRAGHSGAFDVYSMLQADTLNLTRTLIWESPD